VRVPRLALPRWITSSAIPLHVLILAGLALVLYAYGIALLLVDEPAFQVLVREDGLVEWLTVAALAAAFVCALVRRAALRRAPGSKPARTVWLVLAVLFVFGALEEISYGQRILGIETPGFLIRSGEADAFYNRQGEITIHNLSIGGVNINKLVFGKLITLLVWLYLVAAPIVYRHWAGFRHFVDRRAIPIIQNYQLALYLAVMVGYVSLLSVHKVVELVEFASCFVILMTILHPFNKTVLTRRAN